MGACGCFECGKVYRLEGPENIIYLIRLTPACDYCEVGTSVFIERVDKKKHDWMKTEVEEAEEFPVSYEMDGVPVSVIKAGASQEQLKKAGKKCAFEGCNEITAEILADEMYDLLPQIPELVHN